MASAAVFVAGAVLLTAFAAVERRALEPVVPVWVFGRRMLAGANLASLILGVVTIGLSSFLPTFVQGSLGGTPLVAGFALAGMSIGWPVASSLSGRLYLRIGFRDAALLGAGINALAALMLTALRVGSPPWQAALAAFVMGLGMGTGSTSLLVGVQSVVDWGRRGVATGSVMFMRTVGSAVGAAVFGSIVNATLAAWIRRAPAALAGRVPHSLNTVSAALGGAAAGRGDPRVVAFLRQGVYLGVHRVFVCLVVAALLAMLAEAWMPRRARTLTFPEQGAPRG